MIIITPFPHFLRINWTQNHFKINSKVLPLRLSNFKMFSFFSVISPSLCLVPVFQAWNLFNLIFFLTRQNPFVIYHFIFKFFCFFCFLQSPKGIPFFHFIIIHITAFMYFSCALCMLEKLLYLPRQFFSLHGSYRKLYYLVKVADATPYTFWL